MDRRMLMAAVFMMAIVAIYQFFAPHPPSRGAKHPAGMDTTAAAGLDTARATPGATLSQGGGSPGGGAPGSLGAGGLGSAGTTDRIGTGAGTPGGNAPTAPMTPQPDSLAWGDPALGPSTLTVDTPLYVATFNTRGALLTSWRLKKFGGPSGEPWVELVPPDSDGGLNLVLETTTGRIDFSRVHFRTGEGDLHLDASRPTGSVTFDAPGPGGVVVREVLTFSDSSYSFGVDLQVVDASGRPYTGSERPTFEWLPGLDFTEPDVESETQRFGVAASLPDRVFSAHINHFRKHRELERHPSANWGALRNKYFMLAMVPSTPGRLQVGFSGDPERARISMIGGMSPLAEVAGPAATAGIPFHPGDLEVYLGPMDYHLLESYGRGLEQAVDLGWRWIRPLSRVTHWLLVQIHRVIPNWGFAIILLAALAKLLFHPLTHHQVKSMRSMQRIQPQMTEIRDKYKSDPQRQQREMMKLYRDAGVNPMSGCLPMLIQSPVFMALYNVLQHAIELRQAPFILWINDLSSQDALFTLPFALPFLGHMFNLLPFFMGASMYMQQKTSMPAGTAPDPRTQMMGYLTPPMMTVLFYRFPSGLVIYWIVNTLLTIWHQHHLNRNEHSKAVAPSGPRKKRRRGRGGTPGADGGRREGSEPAITAGMSSSEE